jgi:hypothetical protein
MIKENLRVSQQATANRITVSPERLREVLISDSEICVRNGFPNFSLKNRQVGGHLPTIVYAN